MSEVKYAEDRPKDCRYCYFWSGKKKGCDLGDEENCYYRIRPEEIHTANVTAALTDRSQSA